uniref:Secreted protein n=1 Tax=Triticum urartu TaxID=4572 RepID=A0A8R7VJB9_TRIUA
MFFIVFLVVYGRVVGMERPRVEACCGLATSVSFHLCNVLQLCNITTCCTPVDSSQEQDDETRLVPREAESSTPNRLRRRSCGEWTHKAWLRGFGGAVGCGLQPHRTG